MADEPNDMLGRILRELIESRRALEERIDAVEVRLESFRSEALGHFDKVYGRLDRLDDEYQAIRTALMRIEQTMAEDNVRREALRRQIDELRQRLALLEERLNRLEDESGAHDA